MHGGAGSIPFGESEPMAAKRLPVTSRAHDTPPTYILSFRVTSRIPLFFKTRRSMIHRRDLLRLLTICAVTLLFGAASLSAQQWKAPTTMKKLSNGLTVVVSEDHSAPTFGI